MRAAILFAVLWLACNSKEPTQEALYSAELFAAEGSGKTCKEAVANVAAVEARWAPVWTAKGGRPPTAAPKLVCQ